MSRYIEEIPLTEKSSEKLSDTSPKTSQTVTEPEQKTLTKDRDRSKIRISPWEAPELKGKATVEDAIEALVPADERKQPSSFSGHQTGSKKEPEKFFQKVRRRISSRRSGGENFKKHGFESKLLTKNYLQKFFID